jgi:hypothetical protein
MTGNRFVGTATMRPENSYSYSRSNADLEKPLNTEAREFKEICENST